MARKTIFKKSQIKHSLNFFTFSKNPIRSILVVLTLGISLGIAYEEMVGIEAHGTSFKQRLIKLTSVLHHHLVAVV